MANKTEYDIGYLNGFYSALKGVHFIASQDDATTDEIREGCEDIFADMDAEGELAYIRNNIDEFIEVANHAHAEGRDEEFLAMLDSMIEERDNKNL